MKFFSPLTKHGQDSPCPLQPLLAASVAVSTTYDPAAKTHSSIHVPDLCMYVPAFEYAAWHNVTEVTKGAYDACSVKSYTGGATPPSSLPPRATATSSAASPATAPPA